MEHMNQQEEFIPQELMIAPGAQTGESIAILWKKPLRAAEIKEYQVLVDGEVKASTPNTDYTCTGLEAGREYQIEVRSVLKDGTLSPRTAPVRSCTKSKPELFNIIEFGAVADGKTVNTEAIQKAIDACTEGGKVYIPAGTFLSGAVYLKSGMTLYIEEGGILLGSADPSDYPLMKYRFEGREEVCYASLVNTKEEATLRDIIIEGRGTIDANGNILIGQELAENKGIRGRAVCMRNVQGLYLKDITVRQSPAWCVHLIYCRDVSVNHVTIHTKYDADGNRYGKIYNGDGLDPDSCSNVAIFNCVIASQDDCIAVKSGRDEEGRAVGVPCQDIRITNCTFKSGFGVAVGSEMSGGVRNVLVQDCRFEDTYSVASIKAPRGRGGVIENIRYEDCVHRNRSQEFEDCKWFRGALYVDQFYSHETFDPEKEEAFSDGTAVLKNICFKNITLDTSAGNAIFLAGLPESPLRNIRMEKIHATGKYGMKAQNIDGLTMQEVEVKAGEGEAFFFHHIENGALPQNLMDC